MSSGLLDRQTGWRQCLQHSARGPSAPCWQQRPLCHIRFPPAAAVAAVSSLFSVEHSFRPGERPPLPAQKSTPRTSPANSLVRPCPGPGRRSLVPCPAPFPKSGAAWPTNPLPNRLAPPLQFWALSLPTPTLILTSVPLTHLLFILQEFALSFPPVILELFFIYRNLPFLSFKRI